MISDRSRVAALLVTILTLVTALLAAPGAAVPIPQDPGGDSVVPGHRLTGPRFSG